jgi:hypothetical protein
VAIDRAGEWLQNIWKGKAMEESKLVQTDFYGNVVLEDVLPRS